MKGKQLSFEDLIEEKQEKLPPWWFRRAFKTDECNPGEILEVYRERENINLRKEDMKKYRVETTFTLKRFDTFERLDDVVNKFCKKHDVIEVKPFTHKCKDCDGNIGYMIVYLEKHKRKYNEN